MELPIHIRNALSILYLPMSWLIRQHHDTMKEVYKRANYNSAHFPFRAHHFVTGHVTALSPESRVPAVKNGLFRPSKHQNSVIFQDIYMTFCTHIYMTAFFHIYSGFLKIWKRFRKKIENDIFCWMYFFLLKFSKNSRWQLHRNVRGPAVAMVHTKVRSIFRLPDDFFFRIVEWNYNH